MTLDFLNATDEHDLSLQDSLEHGEIIFAFLNALASCRIIRDAWLAQRYNANGKQDVYRGITLYIDSRPHGNK